MRPLKMTMTAFGPYKHKEIVDFGELKENKLFVISGNTGAGKTTIFDAICFALYGDASGEDRNDIRMLRSDFADEDVHTSVEFEFEIKGRAYRVFRQLAHVKAGNKSATGDKYEFYEVTTEKEIPLTDRFIVSQVNDKIQAIIGLTKEQFSQIVMLPQGEFRKLLTSETENKEEILRRIFKTSFYKSVAEHLNGQRREFQKLFDEQVKARDVYIQSVKASLPVREGSSLFQTFSQDYFNTHQVVSGLDQEITFYEEQMKDRSRDLQQKTKQFQEYTNQFHRAQTINERYDQYDKKKLFKESLESKGSEIKGKEQKFELAEKASHLEVFEKGYEDSKTELKRRNEELEEAQQNYKYTEKALEEAKNIYDQEEKNKDVREQVAKELNRLQEFYPVVSELDKKNKHINNLEKDVQRLTVNEEKLDRELQTKKAEKLALMNQLKPLEEKVRTLPEKMENISNVREKFIILKDYLKLYTTARDDYKKAQEEKKKYEIKENEFQTIEARWIDGQASILANHLHDGKPCPVCGSGKHPKKAELTDDIPSKEELEDKRKEKRELEKIYSNAAAKANASMEQMKEKKEEVLSIGFDPENAQEHFTELKENGLELDKEIKQLKEDQQNLDQLRKTLDFVEKDIELKIKMFSDNNKELNNRKSEFQTEKSLYEQSIEKIPKELRSLLTA